MVFDDWNTGGILHRSGRGMVSPASAQEHRRSDSSPSKAEQVTIGKAALILFLMAAVFQAALTAIVINLAGVCH